MESGRMRWMAAAASGALALAAGSALADDDRTAGGPQAAQRVETVIVSARRVAENLQEVPLAIRVLDEAEITRDGIRCVADVARLTAGLTFDIGGFPNDTRPALRGMQAERGRPSVAILLDGQDLSTENLSIAGGGAALATSLFDLERVEVVKGPQSTLYGRNAFAGAINYISKKPEFETNGRFSVEGATGGQIQASGGFTGPIIADRLAYRLNAAFRSTDGFWTNPVNGGPLGAEEFKGAGLSLLYTPTEAIDITARLQTSRTDASDLPTAFVGANVRRPVPGGTFTAGPPGTPPTACPPSLTGLPPAVFAACTRGTFVGEIRASERDVQMSFNAQDGRPPLGMKMNQDIGSLSAVWRSDFGTLTYAFGWKQNKSYIEQDGDFTNFPGPPGMVLSLSVMQKLTYENESLNNDLYWSHTIGRFDVLAGVQVFNEESSLINASQFWLRNPASPLAGPPFFLSPAQFTDAFPQLFTRETDYRGIYGSVQWRVTDRWKVGLEARHNADDITYTNPGYTRQTTSLQRLRPACLPGFAQGATLAGPPGPGQPPPGVVVACPRTQTLSYEEVTPRLTVDWQVTDNVLIYSTGARGYKPGGFNTNEVTELVGQGYRPEFVMTYEMGVKSQWFDRRLTVNVDIFLNDYTDQQIGVQLTNPGGVTSAGIVNAGAVETRGFEVDADWLVTPDLALRLGYAYTDATYEAYIQGPRPGSPATEFTRCGVPAGQTSSDQNRAEAGNSCADFSGNEVGKSPKHSLNASALYRRSFGDNGASWYVQLAAQYRSRRFTDESNLAYLPAYTNVDLTAGLEFENATITAFVRNLTDDDKIKSAQRNIDLGTPEGFAPGRAFLAYLPTPRVVGVRLEMALN